MKIKTICIIASVILALCSLSSCFSNNANDSDTPIVTTSSDEQNTSAEITTEEVKQELTREEAEAILKEYIDIHGEKQTVFFQILDTSQGAPIKKNKEIILEKAVTYTCVQEGPMSSTVKTTSTIGYTSSGLLSYSFKFEPDDRSEKPQIVITKELDDTYVLYYCSKDHVLAHKKIKDDNNFRISDSSFNSTASHHCGLAFCTDSREGLNKYVKYALVALNKQLAEIDPSISAELFGMK